MGEPKNLGLAAAVAGGYLLGRGKKGQMALTAAAMLAGRGLRPGGLVADGIRRIPGVPAPSKEPDTEGAEGDEPPKAGHGDAHHPHAHGRLSRTARGAAASVANRGITALTDALHEHTQHLADEPSGGDAEEPDADSAQKEARDEPEEESAEGKTEDGSEPSGPKKVAKKAAQKAAPGKRPAKKAAAKKPTATRGPAGKKAAPASKTTARKNQSTQKAAPRTRRER